MYYVVKTMERRKLKTPKQVLVRIHCGSADGIEHYWDLWNKVNPDQRRFDCIYGDACVSMQAAVKQLKTVLG